MSNTFDLTNLSSKTLMALATALEDPRIANDGADDGNLYEAIYTVLGDRGENRFCGEHLELLCAPDFCPTCLALPENAQYRP